MDQLTKAAGDKDVSAALLGVLFWLHKNPKATLQDAADRFGKSRAWVYRLKGFMSTLNYNFLEEPIKPKPHVVENASPPIPVMPHIVEPVHTVKPWHETTLEDSMKWVDPLVTDDDDYQLFKYYLSHNHPRPEEDKDIEEARKAGMRIWASVTNHYVGWINAPTINEILGDEPNEKALKQAWLKWNSFGYRNQNISGILDWYKDLALDEFSEPWNKRRSNGTNGHSTGQLRKEHGESEVDNSDVEYGTVIVKPPNNNSTG